MNVGNGCFQIITRNTGKDLQNAKHDDQLSPKVRAAMQTAAANAGPKKKLQENGKAN